MDWQKSGKSWTATTAEVVRKALFNTERAEETVGAQLRERDESILASSSSCRERLLQGHSVITSRESGIVRNGERWLAG